MNFPKPHSDCRALRAPQVVIARFSTMQSPTLAAVLKIVMGKKWYLSYEALVVQACEATDLASPGHKLESTRAEVRLLWPLAPEQVPSARGIASNQHGIREAHDGCCCIYAMHSLSDLGSLRSIAVQPFQIKSNVVSDVQVDEMTRMEDNEVVAFKVLRAMVQDTHRMYTEYGLLQMDAKCGNYLFSVLPTSSGKSVDVEVMSTDYGGMYPPDTTHPYGRTTYAAGAVKPGHERAENRERFVAISERTCLAQFASVLLELLDVRVGSKNVAGPAQWPKGRPDHIVSFLISNNSSQKYHEYIGYVVNNGSGSMFVSPLQPLQREWVEFASCWQDPGRHGVLWTNGEERQMRANSCFCV